MYICDVCAFQVEGPVAEDYICPICGVDHTHFHPVESE